VHALALDYYGRTAGTGRRGGDFDHRPHLQQASDDNVGLDVAAAVFNLARTAVVRLGGPTPAASGARSTLTPPRTTDAPTRCSPSTTSGGSPGYTSPTRSRTMLATATRPRSTARPATPPGPPAASPAQPAESQNVPSATSATATAGRAPSGRRSAARAG